MDLLNTLINGNSNEANQYFKSDIINKLINPYYSNQNWSTPGVLVLTNKNINLGEEILANPAVKNSNNRIMFLKSTYLDLTGEKADAVESALSDVIIKKERQDGNDSWSFNQDVARKQLLEVLKVLQSRYRYTTFDMKNAKRALKKIEDQNSTAYTKDILQYLLANNILPDPVNDSASLLLVSDLVSDLSHGKHYIVNIPSEAEYLFVIDLLCYYLTHRPDFDSGKRPIFIYLDNLAPLTNSDNFTNYLLQNRTRNAPVTGLSLGKSDLDYWQQYFQTFVRG